MKIPYCLMLALALAPLAQAEPPGPGEPGKEKRGMNPAERAERLSEALNLTEDQKAKLKPLMVSHMKAMQELRQDESLAKEAKRAKLQQLRETHQAQISALLTPEQKQKFAEIQEKRKEHLKKEGPPSSDSKT
jgi:Spy/CpxP family protein refolding chaperone